MKTYTQADLDLFRRIQPDLMTGRLDRDTAMRFLALGWLQQAVFGEDKWGLTEDGKRQLSKP